MIECKLCHVNSEIKERGLCETCSSYSDEQVVKSEMLDKLRDLAMDIEHTQERFLCKFGWNQTCNLPGSRWMWVKEIKGQTVAVSRATAILMESEIEHYKK